MKRDKSNPGQVPFADLAMATLGPIAALMIIFLVIAALSINKEALLINQAQSHSCESLDSDAQYERYADKLRSWKKNSDNNIGIQIKTIYSLECENLFFEDSRLYKKSLDWLFNLCIQDRQKVYGLANLTSEDIMNIDKQQDEFHKAYQSLLRKCNKTKESEEDLEPTEVRIEFESCSTQFVNANGKLMNEKEIRIFFDKQIFDEEMTDEGEIRETGIVPKLKSNPEYNRIDIFGHTDSRPIRGECRENKATNNRVLSSLRVHTFLDQLEAALKREKENSKDVCQIYERWKSGKLKIYAIGVGEKEPIDGGKTDEAYSKNRRIEIRFGVDRRKQNE